MEITMNFGLVNWIPVLGATIAAFVLGGIWYSPMVFGKAWVAANGFDVKSMKEKDRNVGALFVLAFVLQWLTASLLSAVLGPNANAMYGLNVGLLAGAFFAATSLGVTYIFENRGVKLFLINGGYYVASISLMGYILGTLME
jgi:hypothetical protein